MIFDLFIQFAMELARAILIDSLSGRIRGHVSAFRRIRGMRSGQDVVRSVHRRNRDRLLHRLRTKRDNEL